jgi:hypothetical protein
MSSLDKKKKNCIVLFFKREREGVLKNMVEVFREIKKIVVECGIF